MLVSDGNNKITKRLAEKGVTKKLAGEIGKMVYEIGGKGEKLKSLENDKGVGLVCLKRCVKQQFGQ